MGDQCGQHCGVTVTLPYSLRHLDNILLDQASGEVVHIDYSVCFDKGAALRVPEVVPFRLTQMMEVSCVLKDWGCPGMGAWHCVVDAHPACKLWCGASCMQAAGHHPTPSSSPASSPPFPPLLQLGLGVTGVEGCFRAAAEATLAGLRSVASPLVGLLDVVLADSTVDWSAEREAVSAKKDLDVAGESLLCL